jgi:phospholipid-binding lipoprotein MlaA
MRALRRPVPLIAAGLIATLLSGLIAGCATKRPPATDAEAFREYRETNDPWEPTNRVFYRINSGFDAVILKPAAEGWRFIMPAPVRQGIHNILANLTTPVVLSNDMMQGKPRRAGDTLMRFLINSTVGIGGVFDLAKGWGYPSHGTDFGVTLALWGVPSGPFLFLPVLGPTDPRDAGGFGVDIALDPLTWVGKGATVTALGWTRYVVSAVDARERVLDDVDRIKKTALDPYATFRSLYRQHRRAEIENTRNDNRATVPAWFPQPAAPPVAAPVSSPR